MPYANCKVASAWAVQYYMDPRNFLDEKHVFQFESNKYSSSQTQSGVEAIIASTWMKNANISYYNTSGTKVTYKDSGGNAVKYSKAIMEAGKNSGLSPYFLASRIVKEVGTTNTDNVSGTSGKKTPFNGIYNYYSIGATSGGMSGLEWASGYLKPNATATIYSSYDSANKKGSGYSASIGTSQGLVYISIYGDYYKVRLYNSNYKTASVTGTDSNKNKKSFSVGYIHKDKVRTKYFNYNRPWITPYRTIYGGAAYIGATYKYQYTNYLQKFNVNKDSNNLYSHEYMQNIDAPSKESESIYKAYSKANVLKSARTFYIPVYSSMPASTKTPESTNDFGKVMNMRIHKNTPTTITVAWNTQTSSDGYYVYTYNPSTTAKTRIATIKSPYTNAYTNVNLKPGTFHYYIVEAYKGKTVGEQSAILTAITTPKKINHKSLTSPSSGRLKASWNKVHGANGYQIKYSRNSKFTRVVAKKSLSSKYASYTGKGFNRGVTYYVKVRGYKKIGNKKYYGPWSKVRKVKCK